MSCPDCESTLIALRKMNAAAELDERRSDQRNKVFLTFVVFTMGFARSLEWPGSLVLGFSAALLVLAGTLCTGVKARIW